MVVEVGELHYGFFEVLVSSVVRRRHDAGQSSAAGSEQPVAGVLQRQRFPFAGAHLQEIEHPVIHRGVRLFRPHFLCGAYGRKPARGITTEVACSSAITLSRVVVVAIANCSPSARACAIRRAMPGRNCTAPVATRCT
jgi:hypothetical protein